VNKLNHRLKPHFWWLWLTFIFVVSVIPSQHTGSSGWINQFQLDKIFHLLSHGIAIFLIAKRLKNLNLSLFNNFKYILALSFTILFGVSIEWFQGNYVYGRMFDVMDIVANTAGDLLGLILFFYFQNRLKR